MLTILIVEDDKNIRELMKINLISYGYEVLLADNGRVGLEVFSSCHVDLLIVDIMMPKMNGHEFVRSVRQINETVPVIMVTAKSNMSEKAEGFLAGIDDYMIKPVEFDELAFRIKALLRRAQIINEKKIVINKTTLNYNTLSVSDGDKSSILSKREFQVLFKLLSFPEMSFTKSQLFDEFWGVDCDSTEETVKVFINKIRTKIKDFPDIDIETVRGIGYKGIRNEN